jgi:Sulfotransferase domain
MTLQVFGTGLGRTGTMSLKLALEQLGLGPCHHMVEVFAKPERVPLWIAAGAGQADWDAIFEGYSSAVDYPSCRFWRELMAYYPEAKIIHTVRDPERWFTSTQETIFSPLTVGATGAGPLAAFFNIFMADYGGRMHERGFMLDYFRHHTETVLATVPKDRLLAFDVGQGWEPLCAFLDVPVPDTPFPRENSTDDFKARFMSGPPGSAPAH